ncbi:uncharacterized protein E5676_scaffold64G00370 [Cucumis melo var. makuwa]|uniref:Uncharacterized protein At1g15400 n=2 Tax=Cucumis melo TaxID=3656 RepID=A0A1S3CMU7_CUCME|nr:uncharacterized protein At1g15400 [Cucumis melo]KAA0046761.1 uncharacterized protein E6C27_scaffold216G00440 [Cucumis melo var. makuwa]TYK29686.1 uncharacterized protein E5676_scaffold64G00370 [Cucumis melo var. makuwa]
MAELQRSAVSFRRQGSSGLVWDDRFLSGELKPTKRFHEDQHNVVFLSGELRPSRRVGSGGGPSFERTRSSGAYKMDAISPSPPPSRGDPSSPKFAGCGFCGVFGRPVGGNRQHKSNKRRSA